jgi:hypothetical protein
MLNTSYFIFFLVSPLPTDDDEIIAIDRAVSELLLVAGTSHRFRYCLDEFRELAFMAAVWTDQGDAAHGTILHGSDDRGTVLRPKPRSRIMNPFRPPSGDGHELSAQ